MKHRHSRMNVKGMVPLRTSVHRDPKAAQGTTKTDCRGADGWQPTSLCNSIWQWKPACWGDLESNRSCPGPIISERWPQAAGNSMEPTLSMSSWAKVSHNQGPVYAGGNGNSRAQWKTLKVMRSWHHWYHDAPVERLYRHLDGSVIPTTCA